MRRLLMVGLAESAAEKTMVRSNKGIRGAFVVEAKTDGKNGLAVQLEGSDFETVWQLKEGGEDGVLNLNKVGRRGAYILSVPFCVLCGRPIVMVDVLRLSALLLFLQSPRGRSLWIAPRLRFGRLPPPAWVRLAKRGQPWPCFCLF